LIYTFLERLPLSKASTYSLFPLPQASIMQAFPTASPEKGDRKGSKRVIRPGRNGRANMSGIYVCV
jgi:hypothetical protein